MDRRSVLTGGLAVTALMSGCDAIPGLSSGSSKRVRGKVAAFGYMNRAAMVFDNSTPKTFRAIFAPPRHFDAVQVILFHGGHKTIRIGGCRVGALADAGSGAYDCSHVAFTPCTFDGSPATNVPRAHHAQTWGIRLSDKTALKSLPRTDGSDKRPLVVIDAYVSSPEALTVLGDAAASGVAPTDLRNWTAHPTAPRVYRHEDGDCVGGGKIFASRENRLSATVIAGAIFYYRDDVISVISNGDDITSGEGQGVSYPGADATDEACRFLSARPEGGIAFSHLNCGWSGADTGAIRRQHAAVRRAGLTGDIAVLPVGSNNEIDQGRRIDGWAIGRMKANLNTMAVASKFHSERVVVRTWAPSRPSARPFADSDAKRIAYNAECLSRYGPLAVDDAALLSGHVDKEQTILNPAYTQDGQHPDDAGIQAEWPAFAKVLLGAV